MRLVLVRHAESQHSQRGVIGGARGCTGLTDHGRQQALTLANRLATTGELGPSPTLLTSPWPRARQTAEIVTQTLPIGAITEVPELRELDPGAADGLSWADYRARFGGFDLQAQPDRPFAPGGKSWTVYTARVEAALLDLAGRFDGRTVLAITHAGFIVVACLALFDALVDRPRRRVWLEPTHTALTEWRVTGATWRLVRYNDAGHLDSLTHVVSHD